MDASLEKQNKLTAGENVTISGNTISATDTTYTAGENVKIDENNVISVPTATSEVAGVVKPYSVLNSAPSVNGATDEEGRYYQVQTDSTNKLVVNVPWYANEGGGSSSGIEEITASGTAPLTLTATQTNSRVNISGSVDLSDYLTSAVADETYQEKLKYYTEDNNIAEITAENIVFSRDESNFVRLTSKAFIANVENGISLTGETITLITPGNGDIKLINNANNDGDVGKAYYNDKEIATVDDVNNLSSSFESIVADKQDALHFYSETTSNANISANGVYIDAGTAGVNLTHGSTSLVISTINNHGGAYYNGSEVATVDDLLDYLTTAVADETYQEKLNYYSESSPNVYINLSSGGNFSMSTPSNTLRFDLLNSGGITLQTNFLGGNINFNTLASNSGVYYNGSEVATVDDLDEKISTLDSNVTSLSNKVSDLEDSAGCVRNSGVAIWLSCANKTGVVARSTIYPQSGYPQVGDLCVDISSSGSAAVLHVTALGTETVTLDLLWGD